MGSNISSKMMHNPFYVCIARDITLTKDGVNLKLKVNLPSLINKTNYTNARPLDKNGLSKNPWIIKLTKRKNPSASFVSKQLKLLDRKNSVQIADYKNPIRWLGSGALLIIKTKDKKEYAVINKRDKISAWGNYYDANGGYSSSIGDMLSPNKLALRELSEEIVISADKKINLAGNLQVLPLKQKTEVSVHFKTKTYTTKNLALIVDSHTGTIDFRQAFALRLKSLDNLKLFDGEARFINARKEVSLQRPIFIYSLTDLKRMFSRSNFKPIPVKGFLDGKVMDKQKLKTFRISKKVITPALSCILNSLLYTATEI